MVKPEHRLEYNRWQEEEAKKQRNFIIRFLNSKYAVWSLATFFGSLLLVPMFIYLWEPRIFHPDYVCGIKAKVVMVETHQGYGILGNTADEHFSSCLRLSKPLYYSNATVFSQLLKPGDTAVDIGAGFGYYSLLMAQLVGKSGAVYSFEPRSDVSHLLEASSLVNKFTNIKVHNALLYSSSANVILETFPGYMESSRLVVSNLLAETQHKHLDVMTTHKLDEILHVSNVKLMRVNAMGAELAVLEGAQSIISRSPSISIFLTWNSDLMRHYSNISAIIDDLLDLGFEFWTVGFDGKLKLVTKDILLQYSGDVLMSRDNIN